MSKTLSEAIQSKDQEALKEVVDRAKAIYKAAPGEEPIVETVYGELPFSAILDNDTKWELCSIAYAQIITEAKHIPKELDQRVEIAKLIATNPTFQAMSGTSTSNSIDLLI